MGKVLIGVVAGVFVGAMAVEILEQRKRTKKPRLIRKLQQMANKVQDRVAAALR